MQDHILVTRRLPGTAVARLASYGEVVVWEGDLAVPRSFLLEHIEGCSGLLSMITEQVDEDLLAAAPLLRVVSNYAVGYDNIDVDACTSRSVAVGNTPGVLTEATADQTFALILAACRRIVESADAVKAGKWLGWQPDFMLGQQVHGSTLGVIGKGAIGRAVARRAEAFDMEVLFHDPMVDSLSLEEVLERSDVVTLHCPLTPETYHLIGRDQLLLMKQTGVLVNAARGPIVDQQALTEILKEKRIFAAALDVTEVEPIDTTDELLALPNCIVVPHLGSATVATRELMAQMAVNNLVAGLEGKPLPHAVKPAAARERQSAAPRGV